MKNSIYSFLLLLALPSCLFAQGKVSQKLDEMWNPDAGKWDFQQVDNWQFDQQDREILHTHEDVFINDFVLEDKSSTEKKYDAQGNLILEFSRSFSDTTWWEYRIDHQYDNQNRLVETQNMQTYSYNPDYLFRNRLEYEYNEAENKVTERTYSFYVGSTDWSFSEEVINTYDNNDCLLEMEKIRYKTTGEITTKQKTTWTRDADCRPLIQIVSRKAQNDSELQLKDKYIYTYSDDGTTTTYTNQRYNETTNEWDTDVISKSVFDTEGRIIRKHQEYFVLDFSDEMLFLWTYTDKGQQATYHEYRTYKNWGLESFQLATFDSAAYVYNEQEQLIIKEQFNDYYYHQNQAIIIRKFKTSTKFAYYCDEKLKSETHENLPNISRTIYEYNEGGDCHSNKKDLKMIVFPNPSDGKIEIRSNLLASPNATVRVFSVLGQEVFRQEVAHVSNRFSLDLTKIPNGNYIISVIDGKTVISRKLSILK